MNEDLARTALNTIVDALQPLQSADRKRAVLGALHFLDEDWVPLPNKRADGSDAEAKELGVANGAFSPAVQSWMKKNDLSVEEIEHVFSFDNGIINIIADLPGKSKREDTITIYILMGVGTFLHTGGLKFSDEAARASCTRHNAFDSPHHATTMKELKSEFTGDKKEGWTITTPGLKKGAAIVKKLASSSK